MNHNALASRIKECVAQCVIVLSGLFFASVSRAEISSNASVVSDYRYRGVSLSSEQPAAQLDVTYDHWSGLYIGSFMSTVKLVDQSKRNIQTLFYFGYAHHAFSDISWEVGTNHSIFSGARDYDYSEIYYGLSSSNVSGRMYWSQDYFGQGIGALYVELNGAQPVADHIHLIGHLGALQFRGHQETINGIAHNQFDAHTGISMDLSKSHIRLLWVATDAKNSLYPISENRKRSALILNLSRSF